MFFFLHYTRNKEEKFNGSTHLTTLLKDIYEATDNIIVVYFHIVNQI